MTIEERAKDIVAKIHICIENGKPVTPSRRIIDALTEQDHIARQEQREEDIQRAVEWLCGDCTSKCEHVCMMCDRKNELLKIMKG